MEGKFHLYVTMTFVQYKKNGIILFHRVTWNHRQTGNTKAGGDMPVMYNGIGTQYRDKKNLDVRVGFCQTCKRNSYLQSYEARLYLVIFFIPIIPLRRKMVIDHCSLCNSHKAMPVEAWNHIKKVSGIKEDDLEKKRVPDDVEAAKLKLKGFWDLGYQKEAKEIAAEMKVKFTDSAEVQIFLGGYYECENNIEQSDACFERALTAEPDNMEARRAVAIGCIHKNELSRAQSLLAFMQHKCPEQDPEVLTFLASALQKKGNYGEAYSYYQLVVRDFPQFAKENINFRRKVRKTEKKLGQHHSILPDKDRSANEHHGGY
jgi:tetratricopeptide (TPR) repeat protein